MGATRTGATPRNGLATALALLLAAPAAQPASYVLPPPGTDLIGETRIAYATHEDTLMDIARSHSLGLDEILQANPTLDRWLPGDGAPVVLPTRFILPDAPQQGLVLNLAEKRLYYFPEPADGAKPAVLTYPIGIGRMDWETPLGTTRITTKTVDPAWRPPASIKQEHLQLYGEVLPEVVPAGPDNPLGPFALRLGIPGYLIHGSNKRDGVGSRVSHGCVRMYNEDIGELFGRVPVDTPVHIVNQPIKAGRHADALFVEIHTPLEEDESYPSTPPLTVAAALAEIARQTGAAPAEIDTERLAASIGKADGIPVDVGRR